MRIFPGGFAPPDPPTRALAGAPSPAPFAWLTRFARSLRPLPAILLLVEPENDFRASHEDGAANQVRVLHHQLDRFTLGFRQRPFLEHRAAGAHEVEEMAGVDVLLQERPIRRRFVDVDLFDLDPLLVQETPGILAGRSGRLGIEGRLGHPEIVK